MKNFHSTFGIVCAAAYCPRAEGTLDPLIAKTIALGNYSFRKAGLRDLPFILNLMLEGSNAGVFSNDFLTREGFIGLFKSLAADILGLPLFIRSKDRGREILIFMHRERVLGFVAVKTLRGSDGGIERNIAECGIASQFRGKHHGEYMIRLLVAQAGSREKISAYCTPNAVSMQAALKRNGFSMEEVICLPGLLPLSHYELCVTTEMFGA